MINEHDIADHECKLYELHKGDAFKAVYDEPNMPFGQSTVSASTTLYFDHKDGIYMVCKDSKGIIYYLADWTRVVKL